VFVEQVAGKQRDLIDDVRYAIEGVGARTPRQTENLIATLEQKLR